MLEKIQATAIQLKLAVLVGARHYRMFLKASQYIPTLQKNNIYLKGANTDNITYSIYDLLGNIVREGKIQSNQHIDIRNLHVGMYLIKFDVASKTITKVFRKN